MTGTAGFPGAGAESDGPDGPRGQSGAAGPPALQRPNRAGLFALAFFSGFAVLTIEIAGARLIAPVFGLSAVPWTAVIGVILGALAVGSHWGGRFADEGVLPLSTVLFVAGLTGLLPVLGGGVPWLARDVFGFVPGAVVSALVLFAPPVLCLGAVVPYLVQADTESLAAVGRRAGDMSAAATAGSIMGSFATGFVLLPAFPLPLLLGVTSGGLILMAALCARLLGGPLGRAQVTAGVIGAALLGALASGLPNDTLHAQQTLYSSVAVTERPWRDGRVVREMWQNGGSSSAEYVEDGSPAHLYARASLELLEPVLARAESALVLGGAALTLPVAFQRERPSLRVDVVEIDPVVTELARAHFAYGQSAYPGIRVIHEAGRVFLRAADDDYDLIYLDVFDHLLTVPWTMVTVEALEDMSAVLAPGGVFAANVLSPQAGPGTGFLERFQATLAAVFPEVHIYLTDPGADPSATQNVIVVAGANGATLPVGGRRLDATGVPDGAWVESPVGPAGRPLTDSWAPVEYLQAKVFVQGLVWN